MAEIEGFTFTFEGEEDARTYLSEVRTLWTAWAIGLFLLVAVQTWWLVFTAGVVTIAGLLWFARPIQARAGRLVPDDKVVYSASGRARGTLRDKVLRALAYGDEPLRIATTYTGGGRGWLVARQAMLAVTVAAFIWVLLTAAG